MRRFLRLVLYLVVLGVVGIVGYAVFSELPAPEREIVIPIESQ